jgi:hypothetical protein
MAFYCIYLGYHRIENLGLGRIGQGWGSVGADVATEPTYYAKSSSVPRTLAILTN